MAMNCTSGDLFRWFQTPSQKRKRKRKEINGDSL